jgi:hypothetical protein
MSFCWSILTQLLGHAFSYATRFSALRAELPTLNIEGMNGDDIEMFTRISFSVKDKTSLSATAVLIYADSGNEGIVSAPTQCAILAL